MATRNPRSVSGWSPPQNFEEYRLLCPLSHGGMGEVYLGHDTLLDRPVAIKFIRDVGSDESDSVVREQILNEARAAARLQHPNVVTIYRVSEIEGHPMIISEFVRGQNLDDLKKPVPWQRVLEIGLGVARGLAAAHRRGVLHLDIKPGNVIVQHDGEVKLLDFGLAKLLDLGLGLSPVELDDDSLRGSAAKTPEALAMTMDLSGEHAAQLLTSTPVHNLARGVAADESAIAAEKRVSVTNVAPRITPLLGQKQTSFRGNSSDAVPPVLGSSASGAVTAQLPRPNLAASQSRSGGLERQSFTGPEWELPKASIANRIAGTPLYMAPETWRGEPGTRRADIYSTGALLYELCVGTPPFHSVPLQELPQAVNQRDAPKIHSLVPSIDPRLAAIIERCLNRDPAQRYSSGDELREALEQLRPNQRSEALPEGNPYRGLLAFEAEHRALFFGRKSEIGTILERLRTDPFVLVVADSGIGKSSLCRAGVLPHVREGALGGGRTWTVRSMLPGKHPLLALIAEFSELLGISESEMMGRLRSDPSALGRLLHKHLPNDSGIILFIDQLEEIVTIGDSEEAQVAAAALGHLCARIHGVRMLMTVRSDFLARVAALPGLGDELSRGLYLLRPLSPEKIHEAIVGPAAQKGVHFESDQMVESLANETARTDGGLPLLQFALTELWEARNGPSITQAALDAIGGVSGALARHADQVMLSLPEEQRKEARRILMALVTMEGTRARRSDQELVRSAAAKHALEALIKARLLVARDTGEGVSYEVAHEALLKGWTALRRWLDEHQESRAARQRLEAATAEWVRLGKSREALWSAQQLAEIVLLEKEDIGAKEALFLEASRRKVHRKRQIRRALALLLPCLAVLLYIGYQLKQRRDLQLRVDNHVRDGLGILAKAHKLNDEVDILRQQAFSAFDTQRRDEGEAKWARALEKSVEVDDLYARSSQSLEAGLTLDGNREDVKERLADVLYDRALAAERDRNPSRLRDVLARMALYDVSGQRLKRWNAPAKLDVVTAPSGVTITVARYAENKRQRQELVEERSLGTTPLSGVELPPGSYLLTLRAPGRAEVKYPLVTKRGEKLQLDIPVPMEQSVPMDFIYVPPGRFLFGASGEDRYRRFFYFTVPLHEIKTEGFLIGRNEVTYGDWITYLKSLPREERSKRTLRAEKGASTGTVELTELPDGHWRITLHAGDMTYVARSDEKIIYKKRKVRVAQDWLRMPVGGITLEDATAYVTWLNQSGRVLGARLCTELEWERATRGADAREFPHGDMLEPEDGNFDETYDKDPSSVGPDEVGSHPASTSPFGIHDAVGNVNEWVRSVLDPKEAIWRSGGFFQPALVALSANRQIVTPNFRDSMVGMRVCANPPR